MHRALTALVVVALLASSVPAAATLADGTPAEAQPGATFSGVVGVQEAEVTNEVAGRSLTNRLHAAETNESKAGVVAAESDQLAERLAELEAEKERLKQAYENGSISKGQYQARLAILSAELRAVERQANHTADVAADLPEEALREKGANVSRVRDIAQQANRTGGGAVAEAARSIAGAGVGNGLGNAPNASERGPPDDVGNGAAPGSEGNATDRNPGDAGPPSDAGNDPANASTGNDRGTGATTGAIGGEGVAPNGTVTDWVVNGTNPGSADAANRSTGASNGSAANDSDAPAYGDQEPGASVTESASEQGQETIGIPGDWLSSSVSLDGALANALPT